ncbi:hypothetical protein PLICRDRAFT_54778 [Plicaturopsis crispa FD-325 SS-3]|nr:hypothetical protein PLICRDRAFT_54778 [Plicaturopsis crispa FD-325 SS-3]
MSLQYGIELAKAGMENGPPSEVSTAQRLESLRKLQHAWRTMSWTKHSIVRMTVDSDVWELCGGVLGQGVGTQALTFNQLPSEIRSIPAREWSIEDVGFHIADFTTDVAQDLLVTIERPAVDAVEPSCRIHLLSLSTGRPHPSVSGSSVLSHTPAEYDSDWWYTIQICGKHIGVMLFDPAESGELLVWDWTVGELKLRLVGTALQSFGFLTDDLVMVATGAIKSHTAWLEIYAFTRPADTKYSADESKQYCCKFQLPRLARGHRPVDVTIRAEPGPSWAPPASLKVPFHAARNQRILVVTLSAGIPNVSFVFFMLQDAFLEHIDRVGTHSGYTFRWEEWGPQTTRMARIDPSDTWVCYLYGTKFVQLSKASTGGLCVQLYDFNQNAIRHALSCEQDPEECETGSTSLLNHSTTGDRRHSMFRDPVITCLPCRLTSFPLPNLNEYYEVEAVMLSEDALILIEHSTAGSAAGPDKRFSVLSY